MMADNHCQRQLLAFQEVRAKTQYVLHAPLRGGAKRRPAGAFAAGDAFFVDFACIWRVQLTFGESWRDAMLLSPELES